MYAFLSRDRKVGQNAWYGDAFLSRPRRFVPGQKGGTERLGTEDSTSWEPYNANKYKLSETYFTITIERRAR